MHQCIVAKALQGLRKNSSDVSLETPDPWAITPVFYEREKYDRSLALALIWRKSCQTALEVGCSVGAFSQMLASHFDEVTAIDVSKAALSGAARHNHAANNIRFVHGDLRSLKLDRQYDLIVCAEVLYYIREKDAETVCRQLERHLAANGIILMVTGIPRGKPDFFYFNGWEEILATYFKRVFKETVGDPSRPYEIVVFSRRD
jgi:2-polyprenyl-3-methyl-5-hydroxy-6-metoxy-1,4-benzoquinol methylase